MWQGGIVRAFLILLRNVGALAVVFGLLLLAASYLGGLHPLGDSLAVFRLWLAGAIAVGGAVTFAFGLRRLGAFATFGAIISAAPILVSFVAAPSGGADGFDVTVYSKNTLGGRGDDAALVGDILAQDADVVLLQEVSPTRSDYAGTLSETLPFSHFCTFSDHFGIGVVSRWPIQDVYCSPHRSLAAAYIEGPQGGFWAVSTHLIWPYPYDQSAFLDLALPFLSSVEGPAIVGGDFNMVPWGASVRRIGRATGTRRIGRLQTTLRVGTVPFQIDHILTTGAGHVDLRPRFGSDHHGIVGRISWVNAP